MDEYYFPYLNTGDCPDWLTVSLTQTDGSILTSLGSIPHFFQDHWFIILFTTSACETPCKLPCPFTYMASHSEIRFMWTVFVTIGLASLLCCFLPLASFKIGKHVHRSVNGRVLELLGLGVAYVMVDTLPSAILFTDIQVLVFQYSFFVSVISHDVLFVQVSNKHCSRNGHIRYLFLATSGGSCPSSWILFDVSNTPWPISQNARKSPCVINIENNSLRSICHSCCVLYLFGYCSEGNLSL